MGSLELVRDRLLALYEEARTMGEHQVAYHVLAGVLHAGESLQDLATIDEVERRARDHGAWLNTNAPRHPLSASSAAQRGHQSIFEQLANTAVAARARIRAEKLTQKHKGRP